MEVEQQTLLNREKEATRKPLRICMVTYSLYEGDTRVMRYAESLARRGDIVEVISLRKEGQKENEVVEGVNVLRVQSRKQNRNSKFMYAAGVVSFFLRSMALLTRNHLRNPYQLIHVHSVPDVLVFAALLPRLTGAKIILDIHDLLPEFYASKYGVETDSMVFRSLLLVERASAAFAHFVIAANDLWLTRLMRRSCKTDRCVAMVNVADLSVFTPQGRTRKDDKFVIIYPGSLNWHQGLDIAIRAFKRIANEFPSTEFHIYGEGPYRELLLKLIGDLNLSDRVFVRDSMDTRQIARLIENADLGVVPKRKDGFGDEAFSTKIMEFMALGVPVVVADTKVDCYYFNETLVQFFKAGDDDDLARVMASVIRNAELRSSLADNARVHVQKNNWASMQPRYLDLVDRLVCDRV